MEQQQIPHFISTPPTREDFKDFLKKTVIFSFVFVVSIFQFGMWGTDGLSIVYLKTAELTGLAGTHQLRSLHEVCMRRGRYECAADALDQLTAKDPSPEAFLVSAEFHRRFGRMNEALQGYQKAVHSLESYDTTTDAQSKIWYGLGKTLEAAGHNVEATEAYAHAIAAKPEVIQITVTEAYVQLLQKMNQREAAESVIREARRRGNSESLFSYMQPKQ